LESVGNLASIILKEQLLCVVYVLAIIAFSTVLIIRFPVLIIANLYFLLRTMSNTDKNAIETLNVNSH